MAEEAGFEPAAENYSAAVLETAPFDHSGTPPHFNFKIFLSRR